jgi:hypothetical protein
MPVLQKADHTATFTLDVSLDPGSLKIWASTRSAFCRVWIRSAPH